MAKQRIHFAIDESLLKALKVVAIEKNVRYSELIQAAVADYLGKISSN